MSTNTPKGQVLKHSFLNSFLKSIKEIRTHVSINSLSLREKKIRWNENLNTYSDLTELFC